MELKSAMSLFILLSVTLNSENNKAQSLGKISRNLAVIIKPTIRSNQEKANQIRKIKFRL